jgi:cytochrome c-type biogenesis protein CcsB
MGGPMSGGWSQLSDQLVISAVVVYLMAMLGFAVETATWSRRSSGDLTTGVRAGDLAVVGPPTRSAPERPSPRVGEQRVVADGGRRGTRQLTRGAGRAAMFLTLMGAGLHVGSVAARGLAAGRLPWGNMYEFSSALCLSAVVVFLVMQGRQPSRRLGLFVMVPVLVGMGVATTVLHTSAGPLVPALHSYWLAIHVTAAIVASGLFSIASVLAALYLLLGGAGRPNVVVAKLRAVLPRAEELDELCFRLVAIAFPIWTFAVVAGAIWADSAWGRYWGWDPKETWAFITWVVYAAYLHARVTAGWRGRKSAVLALVGTAAFTFNYFGVNVWIVGLHSYAGVG